MSFVRLFGMLVSWISSLAVLLVALPPTLSFAAAQTLSVPGRLVPVRMTTELKSGLDRYGMTAGRFVRTNEVVCAKGKPQPREVGYVLYSPKRGKGGAVPMVVCVPGSGEIGEDLSRQFHQHGLFDKVTSVDFQKEHPCYLLSLSPPSTVRNLLDGLPGRPSAAQALLADAIREIARTRLTPKVDSNRIYLTGFSYGGAAVYGLMTSCPDLFACGIPVSTHPPPPMFAVAPLHFWHLYNEGDYAAHGLDKTILGPFAEAIAERGGVFRIGTFSVIGHDAWGAAWREDAVWDWAFSHGAPKSNAVRRTGIVKAVVLTASYLGVSAEGHGPERVVDGLDGTWFEGASGARKGEFLEVGFDSPVRGRIVVATWAPKKGTSPRVRVDISHNGKAWIRVGQVPPRTGEMSFTPSSPVRFLRVISEADSDTPIRVREVRVSP